MRAATRTSSAARAHRAALATIILGPLLLLGLAACNATNPADSSPVATTSVDLPRSYRFDPAAITVPAGSTVTWTNDDNFTHNVTFEGEAPLKMSPGETATRTFDTPGTYPYQCTLHPQDMQGRVVVSDS